MFIFEPALFCLLDAVNSFGGYVVGLTFRYIPNKRLPKIFRKDLYLCFPNQNFLYRSSSVVSNMCKKARPV